METTPTLKSTVIAAMQPDPKPGSRRYTGTIQGLLAAIVITGFFTVLWMMMTVPKEAAMKDVLLVMIGALGAAFTGVVSFYFGSSAGSQSKDVLLAESAPPKICAKADCPQRVVVVP